MSDTMTIDHHTANLMAAQRGDRGAFRSLVEQHSRRVFAIAYRITQSEADAEEAVQETFVNAYRHLNTFDQRARLDTWLFRIASNCAIDVLRRRKRHEPVEEHGMPKAEMARDELSAEDAVYGRQIRQHLHRAMEALSDLERSAFVLRHFEQVPIAEIAATLGLNESATKQAVFRAVKKMRKQLEPMRKRSLS